MLNKCKNMVLNIILQIIKPVKNKTNVNLIVIKFIFNQLQNIQIIGLLSFLNIATMSFKTSINLQMNPLKTSSTMKNDKICIKQAKTFQKSQIQIKSSQIDQMLHVYSWRSKSELPIVKVLFYKVLQRNLNQQYATVEVSHETFTTSLKDLNQCTLENTIYLIREAFTGFHGLFKMFGPFIISTKMILLNKSNRCKVWINQNFTINQPISVQIFKNQSQKGFFNQLITIFQSKCTKSQNSKQLFNQLLKCENFEQILIKISQFTQKFKIQLQKVYKFQQNPQRCESQCQSPIKFISNLKKSQVSKKIPAFLNKTIVNQVLTNSSSQQRVQHRLQKSRSTSRNIVRSRSPLSRNRSHLKLCSNPLKSFIKATSPTSPKSPTIPTINFLLQPKKISDYSFERQNDSKLKKSFIPKTITKHTKTLSSFLINRTQSDDTYYEWQTTNNVDKGKKSDLNTNDSNITEAMESPGLHIHKRMSLFDEERNMMESIVSQTQVPLKKSLFSTFDLQKLSKLGKHVGESFLPDDFKNQNQQL